MIPDDESIVIGREAALPPGDEASQRPPIAHVHVCSEILDDRRVDSVTIGVFGHEVAASANPIGLAAARAARLLPLENYVYVARRAYLLHLVHVERAER